MKFKEWLKNPEVDSKKDGDRKHHWAWSIDDIQIVDPLKEDVRTGASFSNPFKHDYHFRFHNTNNMRGTQIGEADIASHTAHARTFNYDHLNSILKYKGNSHMINNPLRGMKPKYGLNIEPQNHAEHLANLDHVTSHQLVRSHVVFRGATSRLPIEHLEHGQQFVDHGYTGTSHDWVTGSSYGDLDEHSGKAKMFRIHLPAGTKAYHLDNHENAFQDEHETLLARGTRFQVGRHHEYAKHHVVDLHVVGQGEHKPIDWNNLRTPE